MPSSSSVTAKTSTGRPPNARHLSPPSHHPNSPSHRISLPREEAAHFPTLTLAHKDPFLIGVFPATEGHLTYGLVYCTPAGQVLRSHMETYTERNIHNLFTR